MFERGHERRAYVACLARLGDACLCVAFPYGVSLASYVPVAVLLA